MWSVKRERIKGYIKMSTVDLIMVVFLTVVLIGGMIGFFVYNNKVED
jgi:hypothetical protein